jgi:hypothetical protein
MRRARPLLLAILAAIGAGCAEKAKPAPPPERPAARVVISHDFGTARVREARVAPDQSVLTALQSAARVASKNGFVEGIDGHRGSLSGQRDWLYFVNGVQADVGAAEYVLRAGDVAWWDLRSWRGYMHVPAVVGSWPEPFVHGYGRRPPAVAADPPLDAPLRQAGARLVTGDAPYRVRVGADADLRRRDPAWRRAVADRETAGQTAWNERGRVRVWHAGRGRAEEIPGGRAVIAAVPTGDTAADGVLLVVAGVDAAAAQAAAAAVVATPPLLARRYAVVVDAAGHLLAAGGSGAVR